MIFIPFIYFSSLFIYLYRKSKHFNIGLYIILIYIISSFFSILAYQSKVLEYGEIPINIIPTIYYCFLITISILPFVKFKSDELTEIVLHKKKLFTILSYIFFFAFLISIFTYSSELISLISSDLYTIRSSEYSGDYNIIKLGIFQIGAQISSLFSGFTPVILFFYFYSVSFLKNNKIFNVLLLLSSTISIIPSILIAGRTEVIYWLLSFFFYYSLFYKLLNKEKKKKLLFPLFILIPLLVLYLYNLTNIRFNSYKSIGVYNSIIDYAGQSFINFCKFFDTYIFNEPRYDRIFPFYDRFILGNKFNLNDYRDSLLRTQDLNIGIFYTYLGDFIVDIGKYLTIIFVFGFYFISNNLIKRIKSNVIDFNTLLLLIIQANLPLYGIFYYSYWKLGTNYFVILIIIMFFLFRSSNKK